MSACCRGLILGITLCMAMGSMAGAVEAPLAASPAAEAGTSGVVTVESRCPTFHWGGVAGAVAYRLAIYRLDGSLERAGAKPPVELYRIAFPGLVQSWTPPLERCLEAGASYAWSVGALGELDQEAWSEATFFRVAPSPSLAQRIEEAGSEELAPAYRALAARLDEGRIETMVDVQMRPLSSQTLGGAVPTAAPDPATEPRSLTLDSNLELGAAANIFKDGGLLLWTDTSNTALGSGALSSLTTGTNNVAVGGDALRDLDQLGYANTAVGTLSLAALDSGFGNTAVGFRSLDNTTGIRNIGIGLYAGSSLGSGSYNIMLGANGSASDNNRIRIGTAVQHFETFIAGRVSIGTTIAPANQLLVRESASGSTISDHVVLIENSNVSSGGDALALKINRNNPDGSSNFITFYDNDSGIGAIEGDGSGGVTLSGFSADFAEWLPLADPRAVVQPGDVVGLSAGAISRETGGAERAMVISSAPIIAGNDPGEERRPFYRRVAFMGQVPVRVRGAVAAGDLVIASGRNDGTAVAVRPGELSSASLGSIVGRALEGSEDNSVKSVRTMVGVTDVGLFSTLLQGKERELAMVKERLASLESSRRADALPTAEIAGPHTDDLAPERYSCGLTPRTRLNAELSANGPL